MVWPLEGSTYDINVEVVFSLPFINTFPCVGGLMVYLHSFLTHGERDPNPHGFEPG